MSVWHPLEAGEPIGVVALSGPVSEEKLARGLEVLRSWGHPVEPASNLAERNGYLAGSDEARLEGLTGLLDRGVRLIMAARGGFGATRLLDGIPWRRLASEGVRFVGFSDLTAVINQLSSAVVQVHGPMAAVGLARPGNALRLKQVLDGDLVGGTLFRFPPRAVLRHGRARGVAMGGNLSVLSALAGTPWAPRVDGSVLFLEEVSESPYRLDRLLTHLRSSASFRGVKALISGSLYGCRPHAASTSRWAELLVESVPDGVPVIAGLPFGHGSNNMAFPVGAEVEIDTVRGRVTWSE